jgi:hypothetical protein
MDERAIRFRDMPALGGEAPPDTGEGELARVARPAMRLQSGPA